MLHTKQSEINGKDSIPAKIKTRILTEINASSKDPNKLAVLIDAAGNTQDSSLSPKIKEHVNSEDKVARSSLYNALGNFKDKESLDLLRSQVEKEETPEGRTKIMQSLIHRGGDKEVTKTIQIDN